ncbi:MAG: AAA family ATPase [Methyloligellaceae bacterium]
MACQGQEEGGMEAIIFCGIQASGKSSFYQERFSNTHLRINLDMLRTRRREDLVLNACLEGGQRFVVDNTNPTGKDRAHYIKLAKASRFAVTGYFFEAELEDCLKRNGLREGRSRVPDKALDAASRKLQRPNLKEGFDELYIVKLMGEGFEVVKVESDA